MRITTLRKELDRASAKFPAAMADETVWRMAKRIFTTMRADGVDCTDDAAVDAWADAFSTGPAARRRAVLGVLLDRQPELVACQFVIRDGQVAAIAPGRQVPAELRRHDPNTCPDCPTPPVNPPVSLPPIDELADAVRESALLREMVACGQWAGVGRKVTRQGFPSPADTRSLAAALGVPLRESVRDPGDHIGLIRIWRLALEADVLRLHRTEVVAGPALAALESTLAGNADPEQVLALWQEIADIAVTGADLPATADDKLTRLREFSRPWGPRALGEMYRLERDADLDDLIDQLISDHHGPTAEEMLSIMIGAAVRASLLGAAKAGAVTVTVPDDPDLDPAIRDSATLLDEPVWAMLPVTGTRVRLTPLGQYLVRCRLLAEGTPAPLLEPVP
jgi:hypothetical protein